MNIEQALKHLLQKYNRLAARAHDRGDDARRDVLSRLIGWRQHMAELRAAERWRDDWGRR